MVSSRPLSRLRKRLPPLRACKARLLVFGLVLLAGAAVTARAAQGEKNSESTSATQAHPDPGFFLTFTPNEAHIGDPVTVRLESRDGSLKPEQVADVVLSLDPEKWHIEMPFRREPASPDGKVPESWQATVRPFDTGKQAIPPLKVAYRDATGDGLEARTTTATLNVLALRPANSKEFTLAPLRDPADIPRDWTWLWITLGTLALCTVATWLALRWLARRAEAQAALQEPELPPGIWALRELDHRSRLPVCQSGPAKAVFSHVSEIVRLYLGRRYGVAAIDMTTHECLQSLLALGLGEEVLRWIREFLQECDMVKFTTFDPPRDRWKTIWHDARLIVKMTTPPEELGERPAEERPREVAV